MIIVRETYTCDNVDLLHKWDNVKEALDSGSFDYLWDDEDIDTNKLYRCKTIIDLIDLVGFPFSIE